LVFRIIRCKKKALPLDKPPAIMGKAIAIPSGISCIIMTSVTVVPRVIDA